MTTMVGGDDYGPEPHDPLCPRSDIEAAWNGADCHCVVIRLLRGIDKVDLERADFEAMWNEINDAVTDDEGSNS